MCDDLAGNNKSTSVDPDTVRRFQQIQAGWEVSHVAWYYVFSFIHHVIGHNADHMSKCIDQFDPNVC